MRSRTTSPEHSEALSRRLAGLSAELATMRPPSPEVEPTRIRGEALTPEPAPSVSERTVIPEPGRHASRRRDVLLGWSCGPIHLGPAHFAVLAIAAAVAIGVSAWLLLSGRAEPQAVPELRPEGEALVSVAHSSGSPSSSSPGSSGSSTPAQPGQPGGNSGAATPGEVVVDVAGKVRRPGIAVLPVGSRVVDALKASGGPRKGVDLTSLNLARVLVDGEQIVVGAPSPATGASGAQPTDPGAGSTTALVNINTADQTTLETLPGVGPVTAQAIITWRTDNGGFSAVAELLEVKGIGEKTLADLTPHVTI